MGRVLGRSAVPVALGYALTCPETSVDVILAATPFATDRSARLRRLAAPPIAVGSVSLTAYVGHIIAIKTLGIDDLPTSGALSALACLAAASMLLAVAWTRAFRRGPLEYILHATTTPARLIN
ncbi:DUF418 domain-containing protein [Streptomyces sp. NPDC097610]|uniref:DUF418 domain-containing protein n=1 Tax=Streptomyces sp. NPDC097610 TaxID=3157227 RepID=UPI003331BD9C